MHFFRECIIVLWDVVEMKELSTLQWEESGSDAFHFGKPLLQENEVQSKVVLRLLAEEFQFSTSSD